MKAQGKDKPAGLDAGLITVGWFAIAGGGSPKGYPLKITVWYLFDRELWASQSILGV